MHEFLQKWTRSGTLQNEAANKLDEWLQRGSRIGIYPETPPISASKSGCQRQYFYVWLDAPIGYMGSFREFMRQKGIDFKNSWRSAGEGTAARIAPSCIILWKGILYFHALFWPFPDCTFPGIASVGLFLWHGF